MGFRNLIFQTDQSLGRVYPALKSSANWCTTSLCRSRLPIRSSFRKEDVTAEAYQREKDIYASQAAATGKPPHVVEKIVAGKMSKFYEEVCLNEQPFIKDQTIKVSELIAAKSDKLGEKIVVRRFERFEVGGSSWSAAADREGPEGGDEAGIAV
jgi:hypothetical protein